MRRLCEKPGCGAPAEASYGIDQVRLVVWIDVLEVAERESAGRLCRRHADALEGPRGWTTDDRRQPVPTLFRTKGQPDADAGTTKPRKERRPRTAHVDTPSLFESIRRDLQAGAETEDAPPGSASQGDEQPADGASGAEATEVQLTETESADGIDPDETKAIPWSPRLGRGASDDDNDTKPAFGRLLGRAFGDGTGDR